MTLKTILNGNSWTWNCQIGLLGTFDKVNILHSSPLSLGFVRAICSHHWFSIRTDFTLMSFNFLRMVLTLRGTVCMKTFRAEFQEKNFILWDTEGLHKKADVPLECSSFITKFSRNFSILFRIKSPSDKSSEQNTDSKHEMMINA